MGSHEALPEFALVGDGEMRKFVGDHVVREALVQLEKFCTEIQVTR